MEIRNRTCFTESLTDILSQIDGVLTSAESFGADELEIFYSKSKSTSVTFRTDKIESAKDITDFGFGVRAVVDGASGYAGSNISENLKRTVQSAVKAAKSMDKDPMWKGLPEKTEYPDVRGLFDKHAFEMELEDCVGCALEIMDGISYIKDVRPTSGSFSRSFTFNIIGNTNGVLAQKKETTVSASADVAAQNESGISTAFDYSVSRSLDIVPQEIGKNAAELAQKSLNGQTFCSCKTSVIFHPFAFSDLIQNAFAPAIDADNVQKGRSSLIGKLGAEIAHTDFFLIDDATLPGKTGSCPFDDEGTGSQKTTVVKNGVLSSYLYDCTTAARSGFQSTGNGFKSSYGSVTSVGLSNLLIRFPQSDVVRETKNGLYVNALIGSHTANSITGDFSVEIRNAFQIKNGDFAAPVKSAMISGNIFDILKNISGAGYDVRDVGGIVTPSVRVDNVSVIGD